MRVAHASRLHETRRSRAQAWAACLILVPVLSLASCSCDKNSEPEAPKLPAGSEIVARIGDLEFTQAELEADLEFLKKADPSLAEGYIRYYLLMQVLVPRRLIAKALDPEAIAEARQRSEDLALAVKSAGGDLASLKRHGADLGGSESPFPLFRTNDLEVAAARAVFGLGIGETSGAIHGDWGSYVLSPTSVVPGVAGSADSRTVYTVFFPYSPKSDFKSRILAEAGRYRKTPLEVHSRYFRELRPLAAEIRILSKN